jgi:hypothetical protein
MRLKLEVQEKKLDDLLKKIESVGDDELKAHLSKYFCIRISGYLENSIKTLIITYSEGSSPQAIANFLQNELKYITNLSPEKISALLKKFSDDWEYKFNQKVTEKQCASLNSIISNRNNIAHGQPDSISAKVINQYYLDLKGVIAILKETIKR